MVAYILNTIVFIGCAYWLYKQLITHSKSIFIHIILAFIGFTFLAFFIAVGLNNEYLVFADYLIPGLLSNILFWCFAVGLSIWKNRADKARKSLFEDIAQTLVLLLVPALLWFWISSGSFKIGG